jgi:Skp family chaperone for outer membrane proteins
MFFGSTLLVRIVERMKNNPVLRWLPTTLILGISVAGLTVHSVRADNKAQLVGTVDLNRVESPEWTTFKVESDAIHDKQNSYRSIVQEFVTEGGDAAIPPVDAATLAAWLQLKEKVVLHPDPAKKDEDLRQLATYELAGKKANDELHTLENKGAALSDADKKQLETLQGLQDAVKDTVSKKAAEYGASLQSDFRTTQDKMDADIQTAVTKVGTDNNVTYVLNAVVTSAQAGPQKIVLYSSDKDIDLTDKVLKQLNKTK